MLQVHLVSKKVCHAIKVAKLPINVSTLSLTQPCATANQPAHNAFHIVTPLII